METIVFTDNNKVLPISLGTLKQTQTLLDYAGKLPATAPIEHFNFLDELTNRISKNFTIEPTPIFVSRNAAKRIKVLDPEDVGLPQSWLIQRLITSFHIKTNGLEDQDSFFNVAVAFNDMGIQVGFGQNIRICTNLAIFANNYLTTYGKNRISYNNIWKALDGYINSIYEIREHDNTILANLKNIDISYDALKSFMGNIQLKAIASSYNIKNCTFPLNIGEVSAIGKKLLTTCDGLLDKRKEELLENPFVSAYELYNMGTEILKPQSNDFVSLLPNVNDWGNYCASYNYN